MSELRVDTIKPSFNTKVVITPGFVVRDTSDTDQFEVTASGETKVFGPLNVGSIVSHTPGTAGQLLSSQGAGLPPVWVPAIPFGGIIMWYGSVSSIPAGWILCNGVTRTILGQSWTPPDLTDRFVVGAGGTYSVNQTGGSKDAIVVSHSHGVSSLTISTYGGFNLFAGDGVNNETGKPNTTDESSVNTSGFGAHSHTISGSVETVGSSGLNANLPPYYALCYIMRVPTP